VGGEHPPTNHLGAKKLSRIGAALGYGGVGYFSNERGFSVARESSLQGISSNLLLWKRKNSSSSNVNVILTRQTCGQRSSMSAGRKRRALENHFPERICYIMMLLIPKCRGDWDRGLSIFKFWVTVLAYGEPLHNAKTPIFSCGQTHSLSEVATAQQNSFSK